jgi:hypothetical protein
MLVPYQSLLQLPQETLDNLMKEFLLTQMEDGSFAAMDEQAFFSAMQLCKQALSREELVVEYSEDDESIAIRRKEQLLTTTQED